MKSAETQTNAMILSVRELLVKQRTQAINALRGHASEFGVVAAKGTSNVEASSPTLRGILRSRKQPRTCSQNSVRMSQNCQRA
jgi:transposase